VPWVFGFRLFGFWLEEFGLFAMAYEVSLRVTCMGVEYCN
jgi:hypothetical protein